MRTLGKPEGTARRVALGGIAAGLVIGLAACGTTVAGAGTAATGGPAKPAASGGAAATVQPSSSEVNPGGVMIGVGPSKRVALCRAAPKLTRMIFMLSTRSPDLHVREVLPAGFAITDVATVRQVATLLCALPPMRPGHIMCPDMMIGTSYRMFFAAGSRNFPVVTVGMSGCRMVTGLGPVRSWSASPALEQALSQHFGIHFRLAP